MKLRIAFLGAGLVVSAAAAQDGDRLCFSKAETRERIKAERLAEPFAVVRSTAGAVHGDALDARLCRSNGTLVYEISVLDRNGRVIRTTVDAATGRPQSKPQ